MKIKLFWKPDCPQCPAARKLVSHLENVEYHNVQEVEGLAEASYHGIMATPSIVVLDENENEVYSWKGVVPTSEDFSRWI